MQGDTEVSLICFRGTALVESKTLSVRGVVLTSSLTSSSGDRIQSKGSVVTPQLRDTSWFESGGWPLLLGSFTDCSLSDSVTEDVLPLLEVKKNHDKDLHLMKFAKSFFDVMFPVTD